MDYSFEDIGFILIEPKNANSALYVEHNVLYFLKQASMSIWFAVL